jgi:hypothetical protein
MYRARDLKVALGCDWGNASPGCVLWGCALPDGHVHIFDEYKFQRMTAKDVAWEVKQKCSTWNLETVPYACCDPSLLPAKKGVAGEWIGLTLQRHGLPVRRVSNDRVNGWQRVHEALGVNPQTGRPWMTIHPRCKYLTRTLPLMVQAKLNPEDLESDSDDHACFVAGTMVLTARGEVPIESVTLQDEVWTPDGYRHVLAVAMTEASASTMTLFLSNGRVLHGTGNHPIFIKGEKIRLDALRYGDIIDGWAISPGAIETHGLNGDDWSGRFLAATRFITRTVTRAITHSQIWNACRNGIMRPVTVGARDVKITWPPSVHWPLSGIAVLQDGRGIALTLWPSGRTGRPSRSSAMSAAFSTRTSPVERPAGSVPITASLSGDARAAWISSTASALCVAAPSASASTITPAAPVRVPVLVVSSPQPNERRQPVYNLTVDGGQYVANGILVSNCDALRYLLMGGLRPGVAQRDVPEVVPLSSRWWRKYYGDDVSTGILRT